MQVGRGRGIGKEDREEEGETRESRRWEGEGRRRAAGGKRERLA